MNHTRLASAAGLAVLALCAGCVQNPPPPPPAMAPAAAAPPPPAAMAPSQPSEQSLDALAAVKAANLQWAQRQLKRWGYYKGKIDGIGGKLTISAILHFQKNNGLEQTGWLDQPTWNLIDHGHPKAATAMHKPMHKAMHKKAAAAAAPAKPAQ